MMTKAQITLSLFILLLMTINPSYAKIVAEVNGAKISKDEFNRVLKENKLFLGRKKVTKVKVLNDLINRKLGIQKARKKKLHKKQDVIYKMEDILYHAQISNDLHPLLKKIKVTESDIKKYYTENPEYRTAHILLRLKAEPSKKEVEQALVRTLELYQKLVNNPGKFAEYANKHSQALNASNGGDMGFQPSVRLAPEYYKAIKGKKIGHISRPVQTQFGFHIIKVIGVKKYDKINKDFYKKVVYDVKRDQIMANYFKRLRNGAAIKIYSSALK